jgi:hypothetical protein
MLIAGIDEQGCHLYQTCPSGNLYNHIAAAIGETRPWEIPRLFLARHPHSHDVRTRFLHMV